MSKGKMEKKKLESLQVEESKLESAKVEETKVKYIPIEERKGWYPALQGYLDGYNKVEAAKPGSGIIEHLRVTWARVKSGRKDYNLAKKRNLTLPEEEFGEYGTVPGEHTQCAYIWFRGKYGPIIKQHIKNFFKKCYHLAKTKPGFVLFLSLFFLAYSNIVVCLIIGLIIISLHLWRGFASILKDYVSDQYLCILVEINIVISICLIFINLLSRYFF